MEPQPCNCSAPAVQALICELMDSDTTEERSREITRQLTECPECAARLRNEQEVRMLMRRCCTTEEAPGYLRERITTQIQIIRRG